MCLPGCQQTVMRRMSRRALLKGAAGAALASMAAPALANSPAGEAPAVLAPGSRVQDLTYALGPEFPTFFGAPGITVEALYSWADDSFNANMWHVLEHCGTHLDAPLHFSEAGPAAGDIPAADLVLPLAVVDIREKVDANPDYRLSPDDIAAWEGAHGELPPRCCVAMFSGWEAHVGTPKFRNADEEGVLHFPGFHGESADMLIGEREVRALAVDTLSLDAGTSTSFDTHYKWLPTGRYGLEAVASLGALPAAGAIIVVGAPKVAGASGGPSRLLALY